VSKLEQDAVVHLEQKKRGTNINEVCDETDEGAESDMLHMVMEEYYDNNNID